MLPRAKRLHSFLPRPRPKSDRADRRQSFPLIEADERKRRCDVWGLILYKHVFVAVDDDDDVPSFEVEHESIVKCQQIESCQNIVQTERGGGEQR